MLKKRIASKKVWVEVRDKKTKALLRIIYNPYDKSAKYIAEIFFPDLTGIICRKTK